jgi:hypothetical protein
MLSAVVSSALVLVVAATSVEPRRPGQDSFLTRAVFADARVWMRSDAGIVFSVSEGEAQRREEAVPGVALDLCARRGHLLVLTSASASLTISRRDTNTWVPEASLEAPDAVIGMYCTPEAVTVVTATQAFVIRGGKTNTVAFSRPLRGGLASSLHVEGDQLFAGVNRGEFGGGMLRADLKTGRVTTIDRRSGELCGGPLNADCDPVHGIASAPWKPGCVVAAIGLVHFLSHGRLVEICGDDVQTLLSRPFSPGSAGGTSREDISSVAFFGVARAGDAVLAAGNDGLYRVSSKRIDREPLPKFRDVGGIKVSFDIAGFVLVLTDVNSRKSVSGSVPLLVPRE